MITVKRFFALLIVLISLFLSSASFAEQAQVFYPTDLLARGLKDFYNGDYYAAEKEFKEYISLRPDDPVGYWRYLDNWYFKLRFEQKVDALKLSDNESKRLKEVVNAGIAAADKNVFVDRDADFNCVKAAIISVQALMEFGSVSKLESSRTLKRALDIAGRSDSQYAKYMIGFANYKGADHSAILGLGCFMGVPCIPHDRDEGIRLIRESVKDNEGMFVDDIWFTILQLDADPKNSKYRIYHEAKDRETIFWYLYFKYPKNEKLVKLQPSFAKQ